MRTSAQCKGRGLPAPPPERPRKRSPHNPSLIPATEPFVRHSVGTIVCRKLNLRRLRGFSGGFCGYSKFPRKLNLTKITDEHPRMSSLQLSGPLLASEPSPWRRPPRGPSAEDGEHGGTSGLYCLGCLLGCVAVLLLRAIKSN